MPDPRIQMGWFLGKADENIQKKSMIELYEASSHTHSKQDSHGGDNLG